MPYRSSNKKSNFLCILFIYCQEKIPKNSRLMALTYRIQTKAAQIVNGILSKLFANAVCVPHDQQLRE